MKKTHHSASKKKSKIFRWKMPTLCANCPFAESGEGLRLRESLRPGRFEGIKRALEAGGFFPCHETTSDTGNGSKLYCAGALAYQAARGIVTAYARLCQGFEGAKESKKEIFRRLRAIGRKEKR